MVPEVSRQNGCLCWSLLDPAPVLEPFTLSLSPALSLAPGQGILQPPSASPPWGRSHSFWGKKEKKRFIIWKSNKGSMALNTSHRG